MQKLVRRVRAAPIAPQASQPTPTRRLRMTSDRLERLAEDRQVILDNLKLISDCDEAIDRAQESKDVALAKVEALMRQHKMSTMDNGRLLAEISEVFTRQSRTIDPKKFRAQVTANVFWECTEISLTKAKQHLGEKEMNAISDIVPSRSTGFVLKVRELPKKK